jgi:predicted Zn-dependent protease
VGQETNLPVHDEQRLTKEAFPKMQKDYPAAKNPELQKYISDLGMKIVRANKLEGNPYHYTKHNFFCHYAFTPQAQPCLLQSK